MNARKAFCTHLDFWLFQHPLATGSTFNDEKNISFCFGAGTLLGCALTLVLQEIELNALLII